MAVIVPNGKVIARTELSADATTLTVSGLDGANDYTYYIEGRLLLGSGSQNIQVQPNGTSSNLASEYSNQSTHTDYGSDWRIMNGTPAAAGEYCFFMVLWASNATKEGAIAVEPTYVLHGGRSDGSSMNIQGSAGHWHTTPADITSLDFVSSVANGLKDGSWVVVRKFTQD